MVFLGRQRVCAAVVAGVLLAWPAPGQGAPEGRGGWRSLGGVTGYSFGNLEGQDELERIPLILRLAYDLQPAGERIGLNVPGALTFNLEPHVSQVFSPAERQLLGCGLMLRWSHPLWSSRLHGYLEGGAGPVYLSLDTAEQSTHLNFLDEIGVGLIYDLTAVCSVEAGYRFWHLSNAGIDRPNAGIEGHSILVGVSRRF